MSAELPPPGWYPDPAENASIRYWDGGVWTEHRSSRPTHPGNRSANGAPVGKQLLRASLGLFRQNRKMIWLPVLSGCAAALAFLLVSGVLIVPLVRADGYTAWTFLLFLPATMASTFTGVFFNVALAFAADEQIEGRMITVGEALGMAWRRRGVVFTWAFLAAVVGMIIQAVEQRLGVLGRLVGILGGLAWAVATFLVVPVLAFEDVGPVEAVKRSSHLIKTTFGTVTRGALRFGALFLGWMLLAVAVIVGGVAIAAAVSPLLGVPIVVVGVAGFFVIAMYMAAAGMYMRVILYRHATHRPLPDLGLDLAQTFLR